MRKNTLVAGCMLAALAAVVAAVATFSHLESRCKWLDERYVGQSLQALTTTWGAPRDTGECALDEVPNARMRLQLTRRIGGDGKVVRWASWEGWTAVTTVWFAAKDDALVAVTGVVMGHRWTE